MERRSCKLCSRTFANGRALGGHMRSHMSMLSPNPQTRRTHVAENDVFSPSSTSCKEEDEDEEEEEKQQQEEGQEEEEEDGQKSLYYGLREKPSKCFRFSDPEFSFAVDAGSIVQDRESETESSKLPQRRRSKRRRRSPDWASTPIVDGEPELLSSSTSDATTEEDVAICLMMLSRDIWTWKGLRKSSSEKHEATYLHEEEGEDGGDDAELPKSRARFQCETCKKIFRSYQALGGHRSSHKKIRLADATDHGRAHVGDHESGNAATFGAADGRRIHQCPICFRVFSSGQALGGHKRSHFALSAPSPAPKFANNFIDLNLPAPIEDDDLFELSTVSDVEFAGFRKMIGEN